LELPGSRQEVKLYVMVRKVLDFYTKYFAVWVIIFAVVAYLRPGPFVALKGYNKLFFSLTIGYNKLFFSLTMFGIGAVLQIEDFKRIVQRPGIVLIGCSAQFSIMPLGAFALARLFALPPEIAVGLILTGSAPGAMASNVMSYIAKADTAYSVSLTTVSTLLCPLLTPGLTFLLAGAQLNVPFWDMVFSVIQMVVVPLFIGFGLRHFFKEKLEKVLPIFPAIIAMNKSYLLMITGPVLATGLILNIYGMTAGYGIGSAFRMETPRRRTLAIEIGMQNAGLGTVLALEHFGAKTAMPAAAFVFICIITASAASALWQGKNPPAKDKI